MNVLFITRIIIYFICFGISMYALAGIDFAKMMKKNKTAQIQVLYLILAMALAYLMAEFLMGIMYSFNTMVSYGDLYGSIIH